MNIVILCIWDFAGNMYSLCTAINKHTKHKATMIHLRNAGYTYPVMLKNPRAHLSQIRKLVYDADAVVFKEFGTIPKAFGIELEKLNKKPVVVLFGGEGFRKMRHRTVSLETYKHLPNLRWAVTTTTFLKEFPDWVWIPRCVRFEEIREKYDYEKLTPPLITTSPSRGSNRTHRTLTQFRRIVSSLKADGLDFQSLEIFDVNNDNCLRQKAPASIFFDRIGTIYGVNSQEAGAFESAIITGTPQFALGKLEEFGFACPFINVTSIEEVVEACAELIKDEEYRKRKGLECSKYVERLHSGRESAKRLIMAFEEMK